VEKSRSNAFELLRRSAAQSCHEAQNTLAVMYTPLTLLRSMGNKLIVICSVCMSHCVDRLKEDMEEARRNDTLTKQWSAQEIGELEREIISLMITAGEAGLSTACFNLGRWYRTGSSLITRGVTSSLYMCVCVHHQPIGTAMNGIPLDLQKARDWMARAVKYDNGADAVRELQLIDAAIARQPRTTSIPARPGTGATAFNRT
jgi:TPR repeat protein